MAISLANFFGKPYRPVETQQNAIDFKPSLLVKVKQSK